MCRHYQKPAFLPRLKTYRKFQRTDRIIVPVSGPTGKHRQEKIDREILNA
jgi:hypothetical protein